MDIDRIVTEYLHATYGATDAYQRDPLFHTQVKLLRKLCDRLDAILKTEGADELRRTRIIRGLLSQVLEDPMIARERIAAHRTQIEKMAITPLIPPGTPGFHQS